MSPDLTMQTDSADQVPAERPRRNTRISRVKEGLMLQLSKEGHTQTEIAHMVGCSQAAVSLALRDLQDTRELAKLTLHNAANTLAQRVIREADVEQSLEVLDRLGVAEKRQAERGNSGVQVIVAMPGQQQINPPTIEVLSPPTFDRPSLDE